MLPDPVFKGARRAPKVWGIPLLLFYAVVGLGVVAATIAAAAFGPIAFFVVAAVIAPILIALRLVAETDEHVFRLLWLRFLMRVLNRARTDRFWRGASAYAPVRMGRAR